MGAELQQPKIRLGGDPDQLRSSVEETQEAVQDYLLDEGGFAVRTGHHCAQPLMDALGVPSTNRASFWIYNTMREAEAFIEHLRYVVERFSDSE